MDKIKATIPKNCHLWRKESLSRTEIGAALDLLVVYDDDSHESRKLFQCNECGQLYYYEFKEFIDWREGNDAQYRTWVPIEDKKSAELLNKVSSIELSSYTAMRIDFPSDAKEPSKPYFVEKK